MTKMSYVSSISAVLLCLAFANVHAEDVPKPQSIQAPDTQDQKDQRDQTNPKTKEDAANPNESKSSASKEEPECK